jgi:hypothetical protein
MDDLFDELKKRVDAALTENDELNEFLERCRERHIEIRMVVGVEAVFIQHAPDCPAARAARAEASLSSLSDDSFCKLAGIEPPED